MRPRTLFSFLVVVAIALLSGCSTAPKTETARENLQDDVQTVLARFQREDPELKEFLDHSVGYAMFPSAVKGGFIGGAAYGQGVLFEGGRAIGYPAIRQGSVGLQAGAQEFAELVVFGERGALEKFKDGKLEFGANASAVVVKAGAAKSASFRDGVAVFAESKSGAMVELSISGQAFTYKPIDQNGAANEAGNGAREAGMTQEREVKETRKTSTY